MKKAPRKQTERILSKAPGAAIHKHTLDLGSMSEGTFSKQSRGKERSCCSLRHTEVVCKILSAEINTVRVCECVCVNWTLREIEKIVPPTTPPTPG
ncbi:hypothetical protein Baya_1047 [Bagarius yarrelli]|uniref:Uncharacterized protein n=1 Tax=Bagarius yarrelli TaxID=175774 RepID=A0A556TK04_BAGYA|nr:hypothetical protein Baya_1047 [Bagarius yarrelli]